MGRSKAVRSTGGRLSSCGSAAAVPIADLSTRTAHASDSEPLRILQVITSSIGGAAEHVMNLTSGLSRRGHACTLAFGPGEPLDDAFAATGARLVHLRMRRAIDPAALAVDTITLYRLMRRERFDVVHLHLSFPGLVGRIAARAAGGNGPSAPRRVVYMFHTITAHDYARPATRALLAGVERTMGRWTDHFIAGSHAIRQKVIAKGLAPEDRITTIHYGLDISRFDHLPDRACSRHELGLPPDAPVVATVCRLEKQKGLPYLLEAFRRVRECLPRTILLVVGKGPLDASMRAFVKQEGLAGSVRFLGWRSDIPRVLAAVDVLALASLWEAFGLVFGEAGLARVPVAATCVEGIPEVVRDGETGLLVPPEDAGALAKAILTLLRDRDLAASMGNAGNAYIRAHFTTDRMVRRHIELYDQLLADT
jgi:glycosyltransferase involved in cell wall biosynthesis